MSQLDRLQADKRVALDAVQARQGASTVFSLSMKYSFKLSLLPDFVRVASFVSRILRDVRNRLVGHQLLNIVSVIQIGTSPFIIGVRVLLLRRPRRRSVQARQHNWPASRRLARTVLATL